MADGHKPSAVARKKGAERPVFLVIHIFLQDYCMCGVHLRNPTYEAPDETKEKDEEVDDVIEEKGGKVDGRHMGLVMPVGGDSDLDPGHHGDLVPGYKGPSGQGPGPRADKNITEASSDC